jgi:hypothetical protein
MSVRDALNSAMDEEMARDDSVYILGEEVRVARAGGNHPPCHATRRATRAKRQAAGGAGCGGAGCGLLKIIAADLP